MEDIKIIKELGKGLYGTIYKVKKNDKYYALKRQKILKSFIKRGTKYSLWREISFYSWISKQKNKNFFMRLYDYKFYSNCNLPNITKKNKLNKSKHCLDLLLDLKDGSLKIIIDKLSYKQKISLIIQILYIIRLIRRAGYTHNDLHIGNIGFIKVNRDYKIKNLNIKSYGYQFSIIDYGMILHNRFELNRKDKKKHKNNLKYDGDLSKFFIYTLLNIRFAIKESKDKLIKYLLTDKYYLYQKIKYIILQIYPTLKNKFKEFENNKKINNILYNQIIQFIAIYDKKFLCKMFNKRYKPNLINDYILEQIKINKYKIEKYFFNC